MRHIVQVSIICILSINCDRDNEGWTYLFDGKSLNGWEMKIAGYELNNNYRNTFSIQDGVIKSHIAIMIHLIENLVIFFIQKRNSKIIT